MNARFSFRDGCCGFFGFVASKPRHGEKSLRLEKLLSSACAGFLAFDGILVLKGTS